MTQNTTKKERLTMMTTEERNEISNLEFMIKTLDDELLELRVKHRQAIAELTEKRTAYNNLLREMQGVNDNIKSLKGAVKKLRCTNKFKKVYE